MWVLCAALLLAVAGAGLAACGGDEAPADPVVLARANGVPVTQEQVDLVRAEARFAGEDDDAGAALDEAIARELLRQEAERLGLSVDEAAVDERLAAVEERVGGEEALTQALADAGMSAAQLRAGAAAGLLRDKVRDARFGDVKAPDAVVRGFYRRHLDDLFTTAESVDLSMILARTERLAADLAARIAKGEAFDDLARVYSRDPESKELGGELGWVTAASIPDPLRSAVDELAVGETSAAVQGPAGWYLFRVNDRRPERVMSFASVEKELRAELDLRRQVRALDRWLAVERKRAEVELLSP